MDQSDKLPTQAEVGENEVLEEEDKQSSSMGPNSSDVREIDDTAASIDGPIKQRQAAIGKQMSAERKSVAMIGNTIISFTAARQKTDILALQVTAELSLVSEFDREERIERKRKLLERLKEEERKMGIEEERLYEAIKLHNEIVDSLEGSREIKRKRTEETKKLQEALKQHSWESGREIKRKRTENMREREFAGLVIGPNGVLQREGEGEGDRLVDEDDEAPVSSIPEADEE